MSDLISRQALMKEFADFVRASNNSGLANTPTWNDAVSLVGSMPSAQQEQRWMPVSEMLPETDGYYLVTIKTFGWNGEQYEDVDIARYERKNGWLKADKCNAWMPLPEPYQEGEKDD